jgi:N-acetyl-gamma-glutamylphosphate reductase
LFGKAPRNVCSGLIASFRAKAIDVDEIVVDAKPGVTGAGRAAKENMLLSEVSEGFHAYGVGHHRHMASALGRSLGTCLA